MVQLQSFFSIFQLILLFFQYVLFLFAQLFVFLKFEFNFPILLFLTLISTHLIHKVQVQQYLIFSICSDVYPILSKFSLSFCLLFPFYPPFKLIFKASMIYFKSLNFIIFQRPHVLQYSTILFQRQDHFQVDKAVHVL